MVFALVAQLGLMSALLGCGATRGIDVVSRGPGFQPSPDRGLMIVQIDSDIPLKRVMIDDYALCEGVAKGKHFWVVEMPAGKHSWRGLETGANAGVAAWYQFKGRWSGPHNFIKPDEEYDFEIVAGQINYPGSLIVRSDVMRRSSVADLNVRVRNHSAMATRKLRQEYPELFGAYRIRYAGVRGDTFLEHWEEVRQRGAASTSEGSQSGVAE